MVMILTSQNKLYVLCKLWILHVQILSTLKWREKTISGIYTNTHFPDDGNEIQRWEDTEWCSNLSRKLYLWSMREKSQIYKYIHIYISTYIYMIHIYTYIYIWYDTYIWYESTPCHLSDCLLRFIHDFQASVNLFHHTFNFKQIPMQFKMHEIALKIQTIIPCIYYNLKFRLSMVFLNFLYRYI
jgi:hypothetical protein